MTTPFIKPLLCMPSPRYIPSVKKLWHTLSYDKFIVKYKPHLEAYTELKDYFLDHDYTHFVLCQDDLEIISTNLEILLKDVKCSDNLDTISGYCNIDESQPDTYAIHPLGVDLSAKQPPTHKGSYYMKDEKPILPKATLLEVGATGFPLQIISRELMKKVSWVGATNGGTGNFDWQFSKECHKLKVPIMVDLRVFLWHRRFEQYKNVYNYKHKGYPEGYSFLLKHSD